LAQGPGGRVGAAPAPARGDPGGAQGLDTENGEHNGFYVAGGRRGGMLRAGRAPTLRLYRWKSLR